jgi:hypothetical protein
MSHFSIIGTNFNFLELIYSIIFIIQEPRKKEESSIQYKEGRLNGLLTSCEVSTFWNALLKGRLQGREDEDEDGSSYWVP